MILDRNGDAETTCLLGAMAVVESVAATSQLTLTLFPVRRLKWLGF